MTNLETDDELTSLQQQVKSLREMLDKSNDENIRYKQRLDRLSAVIQERDRRISELQSYELKIKRQGEKSQEAVNQQASVQTVLRKVEEEKTKCEASLADCQQHAKQLERVITFLRERAETAHLETKQLRSELEAAGLNFQKQSLKFEEYRFELDTLQHSLIDEQTSRKEVAEELDAIKGQWQRLLKTARNSQSAVQSVDELKKEKESLEISLNLKDENLFKQHQETTYWKDQHQKAIHDKNAESQNSILNIEQINLLNNEINLLNERSKAASHQLKDKDSEILKLQSNISDLESSLADARSLNSEKEAAIKIAQQHLAKRVREATLLNQQNESHQAEINEYKREIASLHAKVKESEDALEEAAKKEKHLEKQLDDHTKNSESLNSNWETKLFQIQDKLHEAEARIRELKAIEEKQQQMQSLLTNLNALTLGGTTIIPSIPSSAPNIEVSKPPFSDLATTKHLDIEQGKLFDPQKSSIRYKQSLFD